METAKVVISVRPDRREGEIWLGTGFRLVRSGLLIASRANAARESFTWRSLFHLR
jgi:hypothetical protein